jgi:hypothetical protein
LRGGQGVGCADTIEDGKPSHEFVRAPGEFRIGLVGSFYSAAIAWAAAR